MSHTRFLTITLPLLAVPAVLVLLLPAGASSLYISILQPAALLIGAIIAFKISFHYRKQLHSAFIFLSAFLFIYMVSISLFTFGKSYLEDYYLLLVLLFQIATYSMLVLFCYYVLKVVDIRHLDKTGWAIFGVGLILCVSIAIFPVMDLIKSVLNGKLPAIPHSLIQSVSYIIIRVLDAALITVLIPVVWLYVQFLKSRREQSLTFTVVISGIICATLFDYLFQSVLNIFPRLLAPESHLHGSIPEALYLFGYSIIAAGLYAHLKRDIWGYDVINKIMSGKITPEGVK